MPERPYKKKRRSPGEGLNKPRTKAVAHYCRTGVILPGAQGEVARFIAERADASNAEDADGRV